MKTVQATEAKARLSSLLRDVQRGEVIEITLHGRSIARLVPSDYDAETSRSKAVERLRAWRKTLTRSDMTVEDILSARDEGRK